MKSLSAFSTVQELLLTIINSYFAGICLAIGAGVA